jgi:hypothetical protein
MAQLVLFSPSSGRAVSTIAVHSTKPHTRDGLPVGFFHQILQSKYHALFRVTDLFEIPRLVEQLGTRPWPKKLEDM